MANIPRGASPSYRTVDTVTSRYVARTPNLPNLVAGEALDGAAPCEIQSDGKVYMCNGGSSTTTAGYLGFAPQNVASGDPVTLYGAGAVFEYNDGSVTPGAKYYMSGSDGRLDDSATTGDAVGVAMGLDVNHIMVTRGAATV